MAKILIFGDSITWGAFDEKGGWVNRLHSNEMKKALKNNDYLSVYNYGISSCDTNGVLLRLEEIKYLDKIESEDYIFIFSIGCNDSRYIETKGNNVVKIGEFENNLKEIIEITRKYSKKIIFTGLLKTDDSITKPVPWTKNEYYENDDIEKYNDIIEKICKQEKINFISFWNLLDIKEDLKDGLHPNSKGHQKIYEEVKNYLIRQY